MSYDDRYDPDSDFDRWYTKATGQAIAERLIAGQSLLELGCATGLMTTQFATASVVVTGVDHTTTYLDRARARLLPHTEFIDADIVDLDLGRTYDHVVLANVVHEVRDPGALFAVARCHVVDGGQVHVTLQNPSSIHRLVGQAMGLITELDELSDRGRALDSLELFDAGALIALGANASLSLVYRGGIMLKPLPNDMMADLPDAMVEAMIAVGHYFPDHCAMNYLVFEPLKQ